MTDGIRRTILRWATVPAAIVVLLVAGIAINAESSDDFVRRVERQRAAEIDPTRIVIQTEDGAVAFSLDGESITGESADGESTVLSLIEDADGEFVGFRITEDGRFEPVRPGEDVSGDTVIYPDGDGGFTLVRPDGSRVELSRGDDGFEAVERRTDGSERAIESDGDEIDLGDVFAEDVEVNGGGGGSGSGESGNDVNLRTILIAAAAIAVVGLLIWAFFRLGRREDDDLGTAPAPDPYTAWRPAADDPWAAFDRFCAELAADPDPTHAIRVAYGYVEQGIVHLRPRHEDETPNEWQARVIADEAELGRLLAPLTARYTSIRFGGRLADHQQRLAAIDELRALVHAACEPRPDPVDAFG